MARLHLGNKHVTQEAIDNWKFERGMVTNHCCGLLNQMA